MLTVELTDPKISYNREREQREEKTENKKKIRHKNIKSLSEPGFDPGTCGLWAHHASAAPL